MNARVPSVARRALALLVLPLVALACGPISAPTLASRVPVGDVLVGSTTTTQDTGLLDAIIPDFEKRTGWKVKLVIGGSGQILTQAGRGDLDVVLTHSPAAEERLVASGAGIDRRLVMHNDFVLVGPTSDPAHVRGLTITDALERIYTQGATFTSRDDDSGTNVKERSLWKGAGLDPAGKPWYIESGVGQLQNLQLAESRDAYTLTDRGTFLSGRSLLGRDRAAAPPPALWTDIPRADRARGPRSRDRGLARSGDRPRPRGRVRRAGRRVPCGPPSAPGLRGAQAR